MATMPKKKKPTTTVRIGPVDYDLKYVKGLLAEDGYTKLLGHHKSTDLELLVEEDAPPQVKYKVLIHEMMHGIDAQYNGGTLDEAVIDRLAQGFSQVLRDNFRLITSEVEKI